MSVGVFRTAVADFEKEAKKARMPARQRPKDKTQHGVSSWGIHVNPWLIHVNV